jgi:putative ABC transport system permease protein
MLQSFARVWRAERGFRPDHLLTAELDFSVSGYTTWVRPTATRPQVALRELMERVRSLPGVQAAGAGSRLPRTENRPPIESIAVYGRAAAARDEQPKADFIGVTPDWFGAMGGRVVRGRDFSETDALGAPGVVLVNETFARMYFPHEDPIGRSIKMGDEQPPLDATDVWGLPKWSTVVGIVGDVKSLHPQPQDVPEVYVSYWQYPMQSPVLAVRAAGDPARLAEAVRRETKRVAPGLPTPVVRTMDQVLADAVAPQRLQTELLTLFAAVALLLAAVGLYGVLAFLVGQRTREIGVRVALGAPRRGVVWLVVRQGMKFVVAGVVAGLLFALALTRLLGGLLYGVAPTDPLTFAAVTVVLLGVALAACALPALRATRVDPSVALRHE